MAKIYDEKEIEDLERQATLKQRQDAAMKILEPEKPDPVAAMREHEAQRRADWHKSNMDARARRFEGMVATEAGRYNPQQQAAALKWLEGKGYGQEGERRRQFDVGQQTERFKAEQEAAGKIGYGRDAASIQSAANKEIAQTEWGTKERIAQGEIAAKKWLGETESKDRRYGIDAEHGKIGEDGKVTPGSRERTAQIQGESEVQKQEAANKGLLAQAEITRQNKEKELATQIEKAQIAAGGKADSAKIASHAKIISAALQGGALQNKDAGTVLAELAEQYKNDPEMLSSIKSAGGGQQQQPQIPGYSPEKVAELQKRGYKWDGKQWVKPE